MAKNTKPTESELEILKVLWEQGASTVREVNDELSEKREIGYTTTLKIMQIMTEKNLLNRDSSKRTHVFTANVSEQETQQKLLDKLLGFCLWRFCIEIGHAGFGKQEIV